jgi:hypothetical protein
MIAASLHARLMHISKARLQACYETLRVGHHARCLPENHAVTQLPYPEF